MPGASRRVRRLEKEAILRGKEYEHTREKSDHFLSKLNLNTEEDEDTERHRRHITTRPIRQIQREIDYPVETMDKINERIQQEIKRRQMASSASTVSTATTAPTTRNSHTSLSYLSTDDRTNRDSGFTGKYTINKHTSNAKLH